MEFPPDRTLLVEGDDDLHVIANLLKRQNIEPSNYFKIHQSGGYENVIKELPDWIQRHKNKEDAILGVVVIADEDISSRWKSITKAFCDAGYDINPNQHDPKGLIVPPYDDFSPTIGIWVMPDNQSTGMLEDFTRFLVPEIDELIVYAEKCVNQIQNPNFIHIYQSKAIIHTWLAWQKEPGRPLGQAITKCYLDSECEQAVVFVDWLKRLFIPNSEESQST